MPNNEFYMRAIEIWLAKTGWGSDDLSEDESDSADSNQTSEGDGEDNSSAGGDSDEELPGSDESTRTTDSEQEDRSDLYPAAENSSDEEDEFGFCFYWRRFGSHDRLPISLSPYVHSSFRKVRPNISTADFIPLELRISLPVKGKKQSVAVHHVASVERLNPRGLRSHFCYSPPFPYQKQTQSPKLATVPSKRPTSNRYGPILRSIASAYANPLSFSLSRRSRGSRPP
jgi:hypothetical protein